METYTFRQFITECENYQYSQEYYDIKKDIAELELMERYVENQRFIAEAADMYQFTNGFLMEAGDKEPVKEKIKDKVIKVLKKAWELLKKVWKAITGFFAKFPKWTKKVIDKLSNKKVKDAVEYASSSDEYVYEFISSVTSGNSGSQSVKSGNSGSQSVKNDSSNDVAGTSNAQNSKSNGKSNDTSSENNTMSVSGNEFLEKIGLPKYYYLFIFGENYPYDDNKFRINRNEDNTFKVVKKNLDALKKAFNKKENDIYGGMYISLYSKDKNKFGIDAEGKRKFINLEQKNIITAMKSLIGSIKDYFDDDFYSNSDESAMHLNYWMSISKYTFSILKYCLNGPEDINFKPEDITEVQKRLNDLDFEKLAEQGQRSSYSAENIQKLCKGISDLNQLISIYIKESSVAIKVTSNFIAELYKFADAHNL